MRIIRMRTDELLYQNRNSAADRFLYAFLMILKQEKYRDITITQLCQEANLSRKTFYEHFKKKEDILEYFITASCIAYPKAANNQNPLLHYFNYWYKLQEWVLVFIENDIWYDVNHMIILNYAPLLDGKNWSELLGKQYKNKGLIFLFFKAGFSEIVKYWALSGFKESPEELAEMTEFILSGRFKTI